MLCTNLLGRRVSLLERSIKDGTENVSDTGEIVAVCVEDSNELKFGIGGHSVGVDITRRGLAVFVYSNNWKRITRWSTAEMRFDS